MNRTCIVVADGGRARFFSVESDPSAPRQPQLVEEEVLINRELPQSETPSGRVRTETNTNRQAGPMHPMVAQRARHELELDRRFARQIEQRVADYAAGWASGRVVLVAEPRLLGLLRETLRAALNPGVDLKELAKDYTQLSVEELHDHLALNRLIPARRASPPGP